MQNTSTRVVRTVLAFAIACAVALGGLGPNEVDAGILYVTYYNTGKVVKWDTNGTLIGDFATTNLSNSTGIVLDSAGNAWVSNARLGTYQNTVSLFDASGTYLSNITGLDDPAGLLRDASGNLFVANYGGDSVTKYDPSGAFLSQFGNATNMNGPQGIAIDGSGNFYTANYDGNTISKFNSTGVYLSTFASVTKPTGMEFNSAGDLLVASFTTNQIFKYDSSGSLLQTITHESLDQPIGFAIDPDDNIYAANGGGNSITAFDPSGTFVQTWSLGDGAGNRPAFIAFRPVPVPEPSSFALLAVGAAGLAAWKVRRKRVK